MSLNAITHSRSAEQHNAWSWVDQSLRHVLASCTQSAYWERVTQCHCTHTHTERARHFDTPAALAAILHTTLSRLLDPPGSGVNQGGGLIGEHIPKCAQY